MALSKATGLHGLGWEKDGSDSKEGAKTCPCEAIACAEGVDADKQKKGLIAYYKMAEACPDWVMPGTCKDDGLGYGAACIKVTKDDVSMVRQQIESMPVYAAFGTNNRFPAGAKADVCRMVKNILGGWFAGAGDELIQADGNKKSIAHAEGKKAAAAAKAKAAAAVEKEATADEKKFTAKAKKLKAKDEALKKAAAKANIDAAAKAAKDAKKAADEVEAANKADAKATKARLDKYKKAMDKNKKESDKQKKLINKIQKMQVKLGKAHKKVLDHINKGYEKKMKKLEDEEKKNE